MSNTATLVNGEAYAWVNITLNLLGRNVEGISDIKYDYSQVKTNNPGRGKFPVSRGRGKLEFTGSITLSESEVRAIELALPGPNKKITDVTAFPIVVAYELPSGLVITDRLLKCEFLNRGVDVNTDTTMMEKQIDLIIGDIQLGV